MEQLIEVEKALAIIKPNETRLAAWQNILTSVFDWENKNLREVAQIDISNLIIANPTKEDIPKLKEIDDKMKEFTRLAKLKETERKDVTQHIDGMKSRLMVIEKGYTQLAELLKPTYFAISKVKTAEEAKVQARNSELAQFRTRMQTEFNNSLGFWNLYIQSKVTEAYKDALDLIEVEDVQSYLQDIISKHGEEQFNFKQPSVTQADVDDADKVAIYQEIYGKWEADKLAYSFYQTLKSTFSDFANAKLQKAEALRQREAEQKIEEVAIEENVEIENTIVILDEKSAPAQMEQVFEKTRAVKVVYAIDMLHNEQTMKTVNKAFYANMPECLAEYQGKDVWKIDTEAQGNLLCKLKNKDAKFQPTEIVFKEVDKI